MKLNLEAKTKEQQRIKAYLEENASDILAGKINNGVLIKKDGKILLNRKTMDGFMSFATEEARKQAEKGARYAMVEDDIVFGWAVHYFEEDSIEGTLFNEDGLSGSGCLYTPIVEYSLQMMASFLDSVSLDAFTTSASIVISAVSKN